MKQLHKEITEEQYQKAVTEHIYDGIFTVQEECGYGVYNKHFYQEKGKYFVRYELGSSCD